MKDIKPFADLRSANLCGADLHGAKLRGADLHDANLVCADLCGANLLDADLRDANLRSANLVCADLCGANLHGANLRDANLHGADLHGVRDVICLGHDPRGYHFVGVRHLDGWHILAGCRWFPIAEAELHWKDNLDALARIAILRAHP